MCSQLTNLFFFARQVSPGELEHLLEAFGIYVLTDTIEQYWSSLDRLVVLDWIGKMIAASKCKDLPVPPMPEILCPFYDASRAVDAA